MIHELVLPKINYFGTNSLTKLEEIMINENLKKPLIITDMILFKLGMTDKVQEILSKQDIKSEIYSNVSPNPTTINVSQALEIYHSKQCDSIIGLGGGSPNDCAKAVGIVAGNGGSIHDYEGLNKSKNETPVIIAINTTAGTASEISRAFLISDEQRKQKMIFKDIHALPDYSINDTSLMMNLPKSVTAQTGMDALTHAIESYTSNGKYGLTQKLALSAIELVFSNLYEVTFNPSNESARENMIYAQSLAGMSFVNSGVALVHAMAHQLGAVYNLPHGLCNAVLLPFVMEFNQKACYKEYAHIYRDIFGEGTNTFSDDEASLMLIEEIRKLSGKIGTKVSLKELGVEENMLVELTKKTFGDGNIHKNPIIPDSNEVLEIFVNAYHNK